MTADIIRLNPRREQAVWLQRQGSAWQVLVYGHAWSHGNIIDAIENAAWLSANRALPVRGLATLRRIITTASER
jgi:hypothetical protein